jgi:hypothetical protein
MPRAFLGVGVFRSGLLQSYRNAHKKGGGRFKRYSKNTPAGRFLVSLERPENSTGAFVLGAFFGINRFFLPMFELQFPHTSPKIAPASSFKAF